MTARRGGAGLPALAVVMGVLGACASGGDAMDRDREGEASEPNATAAAAAADSGRGDEEVPGGLLPGEGPSRRYRLLLINPLDVPAFVFVAAGAEGVALDTVPPRDSARVDVRVRADMVVLEARDASGVLLDRAHSRMEAGRLNRWEIALAPGGRVTPPAPDSLFQ